MMAYYHGSDCGFKEHSGVAIICCWVILPTPSYL